MRNRLLAILLSVSFLWGMGFYANQSKRSRKTGSRIVYSNDAQMLLEAPTEGTEETLRQWLRRETSPVPITTFAFLCATPDVCTYETKAGEVRGDRFGESYREGWTPAIRSLRAKGTDALKVVISELKPRGIEVLAAVRMGDTHHKVIDPSLSGCSKFALEHPQYVIRQPDGRTNETALDYSYPEVRAHRMAIMRELAEKYEIDGLELDFCRWAKHFPRDQGVEKAPILTAYLREIRQMLTEAARKRGRKQLILGARVPETVRDCWLAGMDVETWVSSGWLDYMAVSTWNETDPQIRIEEFAAITQGRCQLLVSMGDMMGGVWNGPPKIMDRGRAQAPREGYSGMVLTPEEARASAMNYYSWGAGGIFFWNISVEMGQKGLFGASPTHDRIFAWMNAVVDRETAAKGPRRYHYLPLYKWNQPMVSLARNYAFYGQGQSPLGTVKTQILSFPQEEAGQRKAYNFRMADGRNGERLAGTLRFRVFHLRPDDRMEVDINGQPVPPGKIQRVFFSPEKIGLPGAWFEIALQDCPKFRGDNELGLILHSSSKQNSVPYMEELDVFVQ